MCVHARACGYTCTLGRAHICMRPYRYKHTHMYADVYMCNVHVHTHKHVHIYAFICTHAHACIYHTHTGTHRFTQIYINTDITRYVHNTQRRALFSRERQAMPADLHCVFHLRIDQLIPQHLL